MHSDLNINLIKKDVIAFVGEEVWNKLQDKAKTGIITSELCYSSFKSNTIIDYSSVIVPAMKSLELELRNTFYEPYYNYIISHYTPNQYAHQLNWPKGYPGDKEAAENRRKILLFNKSVLCFQPLSKEFTIGNFRYTIGASENYCIRVDEPFIQYCLNDLFKGYSINKEDIRRWIKALVPEIEGLKKLRNDSAHAGIIQNEFDARTVLNKLIRVENIMGLIVSPPFLS